MDSNTLSVCIVLIHQNDVVPGLARYLSYCRELGFDIVTHHGSNPCRHDNPLYEKYLNCAHARNAARHIALRRSKAERFLFLDSDVVPPTNTIPDLWFQSHPVACGWYQRKEPFQVSVKEAGKIRVHQLRPFIAGRWVERDLVQLFYWPRQRPMQTHVVGLGCAMIERSLVESIPFEHGTDRLCRAADFGYDMIIGECFAYGLQLHSRQIVAELNPNVICEHVTRPQLTDKKPTLALNE